MDSHESVLWCRDIPSGKTTEGLQKNGRKVDANYANILAREVFYLHLSVMSDGRLVNKSLDLMNNGEAVASLG
jgi:hypothetical protein